MTKLIKNGPLSVTTPSTEHAHRVTFTHQNAAFVCCIHHTQASLPANLQRPDHAYPCHITARVLVGLSGRWNVRFEVTRQVGVSLRPVACDKPAALPPHCGHAHSLAVTTPPPAMSRMLLGLKEWLTFALKSPGVGISPRPVVCDNHQLILLPHCGHAHSLQQWPRLPLLWHVYCWDCRSGRTFALL